MRILESVLYAEDLEKARRFYTEILGLAEISFDPDRDLFLRCEGSVLIVFKASRTMVSEGQIPPHGTTGCGHLAFSASDDDIDRWKERLESSGVPIVAEINWANGARSIYFDHPAGNVLEFATPSLWGIDQH